MRTFFVIVTILALSACTSVLPQGKEAPRLFVLDIPRDVAGSMTSSRSGGSLQIIQPQAAPGLDSDRIALRKTGNEMDYYAGARWTGNIPALVQSELVESFESAGVFKAVGSDLVQFHSDYVLAVEIRDFQAEYAAANAAPSVHVRLVGRLIRGTRQDIVFTQAYEERVQASANRMQDVVEAYNAAFARVSAKLVQDVVSRRGG